MSSKQYTREQIRDMLHQIARGKLAIMNDTDLDIYLQELEQQPTATEDKSIEQTDDEMLEEIARLKAIFVRHELDKAGLSFVTWMMGYKANTVNEELLEALRAITNKVENLALWDKTDSSYYKAKTVIAKAEQLKIL